MSLTAKLIDLVKMYPILYDLSNEDYKNTKKKDMVWEEIAEELNEDVDDLKKKWKNLRDTFLRYIKGKKTKSGKKWNWADKMEAFNPSLSFGKAPSTSEIPYEHSQIQHTSTEHKIIVDPIATEFETQLLLDSTYDELSRTPQSASAIDVPTTSTFPETIKLSKKRKRKYTPVDSIPKFFFQNYNQERPEFDEIDLLFLAHARNIKTFSKKRQAIAKMEISKVIMEQELKNIGEQSSSQSNQEAHYRLDKNYSSEVDLSRPNSPFSEFIEVMESKPNTEKINNKLL